MLVTEILDIEVEVDRETGIIVTKITIDVTVEIKVSDNGRDNVDFLTNGRCQIAIAAYIRYRFTFCNDGNNDFRKS